MASKLTFKNTDALKFVLQEFNNSSFKDVVSFSVAHWIMNENIGSESLLIQKLALNNKDGLDVVGVFDDESYAYGSQAFVPMNISNFNADFTAIPQSEIKEVMFDMTIDFLVYIDDVAVQEVINLAIEEVKTKLIQKFTTFEVSNIDLDNKNSTNKVVETYKVITMSGSLDYGALMTINGKNYLTYHLDLVLLFTNKGEFANQQVFKLGTDKIVDSQNKPVMFDITPYIITWHWSETITHQFTQLVNTFITTNQDNENETKAIPTTTGNAISFTLQMDFNNPILRDLYKKSKQGSKGSATEKYYLIDETKEYNSSTKQFEVKNDMKFSKTMYRSINQPNEEYSKGEKMLWLLTLVPAYIDEEE